MTASADATATTSLEAGLDATGVRDGLLRDQEEGVNMKTRTKVAFVMQSFTNAAQKDVTIDNIRDLGPKLKLPQGWKFRSVVLDRDLLVNQKRTKNFAHVFQDDLLNAYQGSDGGKAFSFVP
jgi:hypothetical protein